MLEEEKREKYLPIKNNGSDPPHNSIISFVVVYQPLGKVSLKFYLNFRNNKESKYKTIPGVLRVPNC